MLRKFHIFPFVVHKAVLMTAQAVECLVVGRLKLVAHTIVGILAILCHTVFVLLLIAMLQPRKFVNVLERLSFIGFLQQHVSIHVLERDDTRFFVYRSGNKRGRDRYKSVFFSHVPIVVFLLRKDNETFFL